MKAVIYQHEAHEDLGLLEAPLVDAGFTLSKRFRAAEYHSDVQAPLLVVLGGSMSVGELELHPFLRDEVAVVVERLRLGKPVLGICLGAQVLASAAGALVSKGKNGLELSVAPVRLTAASAADPVMKGLPPKTNFAHWHEDTWSPVEGAVLLASTERYTQQAFRVGPSYGFQFHAELTSGAWSHWVDVSAQSLEAGGRDVLALKAMGARLDASKAHATAFLERLVHHFARL